MERLPNPTNRPWAHDHLVSEVARLAKLSMDRQETIEALLEACRSAKLAMETSGLASGYGAKVYDRICQAIAKAEGR